MEPGSVYYDLLASLDLDGTRVVTFPDLILLCGGELSESTKACSSYRGFFYNLLVRQDHPLLRQVRLAENVMEYFEASSAYDDLLTFEQDLAELSLLTVVFVESPGSIAELGSFSVLENINSKLLVVVKERHVEKRSFIWRGPIEYLKKKIRPQHDTTDVSVYDWTEGKVSPSDANDLLEKIESIASQSRKTAKFSCSNAGHIMLLILDLLGIQRLATAREIRQQLAVLGIEQSESLVKQRLDLLRVLRYLEKKPYGNHIFYVAREQPPWLSLAFTRGAPVRDVVRWQADFLRHYELNEPRKHRALASYLRTAGANGGAA